MRRGYETFHQKFGSPKKSCIVPRPRAVTCSSLEPPEAWRRQTAFEENLAPGCFSSPRRRQWSVPWGNLSEIKQVPYVTTYITTTPSQSMRTGERCQQLTWTTRQRGHDQLPSFGQGSSHHHHALRSLLPPSATPWVTFLIYP